MTYLPAVLAGSLQGHLGTYLQLTNVQIRFVYKSIINNPTPHIHKTCTANESCLFQLVFFTAHFWAFLSLVIYPILISHYKTHFRQAAHSEQSSHRLRTMWCTIFRIKDLNNLLVKYWFNHSTNTGGRTTSHLLKHMTSLSNVCCICGLVFGLRTHLFSSVCLCLSVCLVHACAWVKTFTTPVFADFWIVSHIFGQLVPQPCCRIYGCEYLNIFH